jgi:SecD-like export protein
MTSMLTPTITDDEVAELPLGGARADLLRELLAETGAASAPARRRRRWPAVLAAAAAVAAVAVPVGLSRLGDDSATGIDRGTASQPPAAPSAFQVRVVGLTSTAPVPDDPEWQQLVAFTCPEHPAAAPAIEAELACDAEGTKYLLGNAAVDGGVVDASVVEGALRWTVALQLDDEATGDLADLTRKLVGSPTQVALVLHGEVLAAPTVASVIDTGQLQLAVGLTKAEATELAARLSP